MSNKILLQRTFERLLSQITPQELLMDQCFLEENILSVQGREYDLNAYKNIYLLGSGKAVIPMAEAMQQLLKEKIDTTLLIGAYPSHASLKNSTYIQSTHPFPSDVSVQAAKLLQEQLQKLHKDDLFIYLLSGGNSALVELPEEPITLAAFQEATAVMLRGGMPIESINCVRKHLSQVKGGKLAKTTQAQGIVLVLSDVIGDDLHAIGSAPFYYDLTTFDDAVSVLQRYNLFEKMPQSIQKFLNEGCRGMHSETPKNAYKHIEHFVAGSNTMVLQKAQKILEEQGVKTTVMEKPIVGDASRIVHELLQMAKTEHALAHCYLLGGESTVVVTGNGKGGRNQHLCLTFLDQLEDNRDIAFLSAATDGIDGNSDAAGAVVDNHSRNKALSLQLDPKAYLKRFDSNRFFSATGELLSPGATHNNLLDIVMMLIEPKPTQGEING